MNLCVYEGNADDDEQVFWLHDGVIFGVGQISYSHNKRIHADSFDVIIASARESDQGLYQCQTLPSRLRAITYLWVDGK